VSALDRVTEAVAASRPNNVADELLVALAAPAFGGKAAPAFGKKPGGGVPPQFRAKGKKKPPPWVKKPDPEADPAAGDEPDAAGAPDDEAAEAAKLDPATKAQYDALRKKGLDHASAMKAVS